MRRRGRRYLELIGSRRVVQVRQIIAQVLRVIFEGFDRVGKVRHAGLRPRGPGAASEDEIEQDDYEEGDAEKPKKNASHDRYLSGDAPQVRRKERQRSGFVPFCAETNQP